jgi:WD40 repeat protein
LRTVLRDNPNSRAMPRIDCPFPLSSYIALTSPPRSMSAHPPILRLLDRKVLATRGWVNASPAIWVSSTPAMTGKSLAAANGQEVGLWDTRTGAKMRTLRGHVDAVAAVAFSPKGRVLAARSQDGLLRLWRVN